MATHPLVKFICKHHQLERPQFEAFFLKDTIHLLDFGV